MNGRPSKTTVDYFPHYTTSGKTIFTLESLYGNDGYAFWFKILEILGSSEGHAFRYENISDWLYLVAKTKVSEEKAKAILQTLADLGAIDRELYKDKCLWSDNFLKGLIPVYSKRSTETPVKPILRGEKVLSGPKTPQSKVKDSKEEESKEPPSDEKTSPCPHLEIISLYNHNLPTLTKVIPKLWNGVREKQLQARWREDPERQNLRWWANLFVKISQSTFLLGDNEKNWKADLGWITKQSNMTKILEGKYNNSSKKVPQNQGAHNGFNQRNYGKLDETSIPDFLK